MLYRGKRGPNQGRRQGSSARGEAGGATLFNLRFKALSNPQSLGTCFGSSQLQIGQIPLPPKAHFHQVLMPLSLYDLQSQSKGEYQPLPTLLVWAVAAAGTGDGGSEDLLPQQGSLRMNESW